MNEKKGNSKKDNFGYQLLDSGNGLKLEKIGEYTLIRPSSLAIWKQDNPQLWNSTNSRFIHTQGWSKNLPDWQIQLNNKQKFICRLQDNGQIGLFPEHYNYLNQLTEFLEPTDEALSLFAYTGLASVALSPYCKRLTHVDLSKRCLTWAKENFELNKINNIRLISEDALEFLRKEIKREKTYQLIILDPPSFSRITKNKTWELEQELTTFCELVSKLIDKKRGLICFTSHLQAGSVNIVENLFWDIFKDQANYQKQMLDLVERSTNRSIPCSGLNLIRI